MPPHASGLAYTCPALRIESIDSEATVIMDSLHIAKMLEEMHPEPSLHLDSPKLVEVDALMGQLMTEFRTITYPLLFDNVFTSTSRSYKENMLMKHSGMNVDQFLKEKNVADAWLKVQAPLENMAALLKQHDGPFVLGNEGETKR